MKDNSQIKLLEKGLDVYFKHKQDIDAQLKKAEEDGLPQEALVALIYQLGFADGFNSVEKSEGEKQGEKSSN